MSGEDLPLELVPPRVRKLLMPARGGQESAAQENAANRQGPPDDRDVQNIARALREVAGRKPLGMLPGADPGATADALAKSLVSQAQSAVDRLAAGAPNGALTVRESMALEAVLSARGRPALRVINDRIEDLSETLHPGSGFWRSFVDDHEEDLVAVASATGAVKVAIDFGARFVQGTAWLVKNDLVVTNRHVLFPPAPGERLARRRDENPSTARMKTGLTVTIDFGFDNGPPGRNLVCSVVDVPFVSAEEDPIDIALIKIEPLQAKGPTPLILSGKSFEEDQLYIVGHPGKKAEISEDENAVFGSPDEHKRVSLGELMDADQTRPNELIHDASTIGGYSGGCVIGFVRREVVGLHHLGSTTSGNRAFKSTALLAHAAGKFLR